MFFSIVEQFLIKIENISKLSDLGHLSCLILIDLNMHNAENHTVKRGYTNTLIVF